MKVAKRLYQKIKKSANDGSLAITTNNYFQTTQRKLYVLKGSHTLIKYWAYVFIITSQIQFQDIVSNLQKTNLCLKKTLSRNARIFNIVLDFFFGFNFVLQSFQNDFFRICFDLIAIAQNYEKWFLFWKYFQIVGMGKITDLKNWNGQTELAKLKN